jgi:hypothetical protein
MSKEKRQWFIKIKMFKNLLTILEIKKKIFSKCVKNALKSRL